MQLGQGGFGHGTGRLPRFCEGSYDQQGIALAIGLQVEAGDQCVSQQQGHDVVAVRAELARNVDLNAVVELEQALSAWTRPYERVER